MGITALLTGDQLRIEPGNIVFQTVGSDMIDRPMIDADVEVVSPIYGSTYLRNNNPSGAVYNNVNIELVGLEASFIALSNLPIMTIVTLVIGGESISRNELCKGCLTTVSYQNNLLDDNSVTGNINIIKME